MDKNAKIYVAGHRGLVGSAMVRRLVHVGYHNIVTRTSGELDLTKQPDVSAFFEEQRPEYVFDAAAKVGGIHANNSFRAEFIYSNLMIQCSLIHNAYVYGVKKLLFLGSSCVYPRDCPQPMKEEHLLTGPLEPTNEPYAVAKIAGIKMCQAYNSQYGTNFITLMPTNLYGPNDNFDLENSHVLPAMIRKFHEAKLNSQPVRLWGSGTPRREFLHVDDLADASVFLMNSYDGSDILNVGTGIDSTILELSEIVRKVVRFEGEVIWDRSMPDGMKRKLLDISRISGLGWKPRISPEEGIRMTYEWYINNR
ncbi:MAG: GDP-L-fucose synthase [Nitrospirae bacterium]|nr:GDP-L-fucose synthase [Nitrospirota bacterium]